MSLVINSFRDIPQYTRSGSYEVDMSLDYVYETVIKEWAAGKEQVGRNLELNPDFQRGHVWTKAKKSAWIEHTLRGGVSGKVIYLNHPGWMNSFEGDFVLVDGKQRLDAIAAFMENKIKAFGTYYKDYTDRLHALSGIKVNVNDLKTRAEVLQWYLDLNTGGVVHTNAEIKKVQVLLEAELKGE